MKPEYNLDLLRYFKVLIEEQSISAAARRMRISEPAMSRYLAKLRRILHDPILVQSGRRMIATSFALGLLGRVQSLLGDAESLFHEQEIINFHNISPRFTIRANDLIIGAIAGALLRELRKDCPSCDIVFSPEQDDQMSLALREETIDLYIGATDDLKPEIRRQTLFRNSFQALVRQNHPILSEELTAHNLVKYDHISISRRGRARGPIDTALKTQFNLTRKIALIIPTYYAMIESLRESDMILPVPDIVVKRLPIRLMGLVAFRLPFTLPEIEAFQAWHPRRDTDPVHHWLRDTVFRVARAEAGQELPASTQE